MNYFFAVVFFQKFKYMRYLLLLTLLLSYAYGQNYKYCEVREASVLNKSVVEFDFGQRTNIFSSGNMIVNENGKPLKFQSAMDAINMLDSLGWQFVQAYGVERYTKYIMRIESDKFEEAIPLTARAARKGKARKDD